MKLNRYSTTLFFYKYVNTGGIPSNLCSLFWGTLWGILMTVLTFPFAIYAAATKDYKADHNFSTFGGIMYLFIEIAFLLLGVLGIATLATSFKYETISELPMWMYIFGFLFYYLLIGIIGLIMYLVSIIYENISEKIGRKTPKKPNIFMEYVKAKKKKICPIIEYKDE